MQPLTAEQRQLVLLASQGDTAAFAALVAARRARLLVLLAATVGDWHEAEDALQDALWKAFTQLRCLRAPEAFVGWLRGVVLNVARDHLRQAVARSRREGDPSGIGPDLEALCAGTPAAPDAALAAFVQDWRRQGWTAPHEVPDWAFGQFLSGRCVFFALQYGHSAAMFRECDFRWGVAPVPRFRRSDPPSRYWFHFAVEIHGTVADPTTGFGVAQAMFEHGPVPEIDNLPAYRTPEAMRRWMAQALPWARSACWNWMRPPTPCTNRSSSSCCRAQSRRCRGWSRAPYPRTTARSGCGPGSRRIGPASASC